MNPSRFARKEKDSGADALKKALNTSKKRRTHTNHKQAEVHKQCLKILIERQSKVSEARESWMNIRPRLKTRPTPTAEIKLVNLMKIIVEAQWTIDAVVFNDMLKLAGYDKLIDEYFHRKGERHEHFSEDCKTIKRACEDCTDETLQEAIDFAREVAHLLGIH